MIFKIAFGIQKAILPPSQVRNYGRNLIHNCMPFELTATMNNKSWEAEEVTRIACKLRDVAEQGEAACE